MKDLLIKIAILLGIIGFSWLSTICIIKLITLCFGWSFSWLIATGIWIALWFIKACLTSDKNGESK